MKLSIVACAVLGVSSASTAAQSVQAPEVLSGQPDAVVHEIVCTTNCVDDGRGRARVGRAAQGPAIYTSEPADGGNRELHIPGRGLVSIGRQYTLEYMAINDVGDPFHGGLAGSALPTGQRADDSVIYQGRVAGLSTGSSWGKGDIDGSPSGRAWGMSVGFSAGPLTIRAAHQNRNVAKITRFNQVGVSMAAKNSIIAANMRFGWGTAYAAYSASRGWGSSPLFNPDNPYGAGIASTVSTDSRDVLLGVAVPLGHATTLLASYIRRNDRDPANRDARQIAVGASHAVSKRMDFYAACSRIQHVNGAPAAVRQGNGLAINIGMRRAF